jgi:hypothetical protein
MDLDIGNGGAEGHLWKFCQPDQIASVGLSRVGERDDRKVGIEKLYTYKGTDTANTDRR